MTARYDLVGQTFGRLTVLEFDHIGKDGSSYWLCECGCKNKTKVVVRGRSLKIGNTQSCGCLRREANDLTGGTFGRLKVLGFDHTNKWGVTFWLCECSCERRTKTVVQRGHLLDGRTLSCGCLHREITANCSTKHGMVGTRLYKIWSGMRQRCENEKANHYDYYGGRDITIDDRWLQFESFRDWALEHGYDDNLTLDRIDNNRGYSPDNCRWATRIEQQNNMRSNHYFTYSNETHTIAEWTRILNKSYTTLWNRIKRGDLRDFEDYFNKL